MNLIPVLPVDYVYGARSALAAGVETGAVGFCLALLVVAAALSVFGVIALFLARLDG